MKNLITLVLSVALIHVYAQNTIADYDGNVYNTVTIGSQVWMKENLRTAHYADGSLIANNCWYDNNLSTDTLYGKLYNWNAAMKNTNFQMAQGACPDDWHLPSDSEWIQLFNFLGDSNSCAFALKDTNTSYWSQPLIASNTTGFSILGGGSGYNCSFFDLMGTHGEFWTSTEINTTDAKNWSTNNQSASMFRHYNQDKPNNFSIRCLRNVPAGINGPESAFDQEFIAYTDNGNLILQSKKKAKQVSYILYSVAGQIIFNGSFTDKTTLNVSSVSNGIYFLRILAESKTYNHKLTIVK